MLRIAQRCGFGIDSAFLLPNVCGVKDSQSFAICRHDPVLDSVVYHLDKVTGAAWTAMQITLFCGAGELFPPRRTSDVAGPGSEGGKNWVEALNRAGLTANHQAIATFKTSHA